MPALPETIGRYRVIRPLGEGGMARALLAETERGARVVLKMPKVADEEAITRLREEARVGIRLDHPSLVQTLDLFEHEGLPVLVVSWVDGASLHDLVRGRGLQVGSVARVGARVASGLSAIHRATDERGKPLRIVHRDVSCGNVLVDREGNARLIDLGIARSAEALHNTQTGTLLGTLPYLAPELFDEADYGPATDLWALGCVLFEAATGTRLFDGTEARIVGKLLSMEAHQHPKWKDLDPGLADILCLLLDKDPAARLADGAQAAERFLELEKRHPDAQRLLAQRVEATLGPLDGPRALPSAASLAATQRAYFPEDTLRTFQRGEAKEEGLDASEPWESMMGLDHAPDPELFKGPKPQFASLGTGEELTAPAAGEHLADGLRIPAARALHQPPQRLDGPAPTPFAASSGPGLGLTSSESVELAREVGVGGRPAPVVWEASPAVGPGHNPYPEHHGPPSSGSGLTRALIVVIILVLVGIGGGSAWFYSRGGLVFGEADSPVLRMQRDGYPACFAGNDGYVFVYRDASGTEVVKERIEDVPRARRPRARCINLYK